MGTIVPTSGEDGPSVTCWPCSLCYQAREQRNLVPAARQAVFVQGEAYPGTDAEHGRDWGQEEKGTTEDEMVGWHH